MSRKLDEAVFALASLIAEAVPGRMKHKGQAAELHIDVTNALKTMVDECVRKAVDRAVAQARRAENANEKAIERRWNLSHPEEQS